MKVRSRKRRKLKKGLFKTRGGFPPAYFSKPVKQPSRLKGRNMKIAIAVILVITLIVSFGIWKLTSDTHILNSQIKTVGKEVAGIKTQTNDLGKYKDEEGIDLNRSYFELFNDIKEISFYYHVASEVKILGAKDLTGIEELSKPSQYKGIRCVDIICRINLKDSADTSLFETLYKIVRNKPVEILDIKIEKDAVNLTMRLYGL